MSFPLDLVEKLSLQSPQSTFTQGFAIVDSAADTRILETLGWARHKIGPYTMFVASGTEICILKRERTQLMLVGLAFSGDKNKSVAEVLGEILASGNHQRGSHLCGRFAIVTWGDDKLTLSGDPGHSRTLFYSRKKPFAAGSHAGLLQAICGLRPDQRTLRFMASSDYPKKADSVPTRKLYTVSIP